MISSSLLSKCRAGAAQRGAVLVVGLVFLALLTLIGVTAYSVATQEERMAGNARDRLVALEAAEAALRNCENHVGAATLPIFSDDGGSDPGMYNPPATDERMKSETIDWSADNVRTVGGLIGVADDPRCIVQRMTRTTLGRTSLRAELPTTSWVWVYQVTARAVGANRNTAVVLQTTFIRD
jgi:type IV pilus assembly protein PilX